MTDAISYVYFIQSRFGGLIKIGVASDVPRRLANLQAGSPVPLKLLAAIEGDRETEMEHHIRFKTLRVRGEWFEPHPELTDYINTLIARGLDIMPGSPPRITYRAAERDATDRDLIAHTFQWTLRQCEPGPDPFVVRRVAAKAGLMQGTVRNWLTKRALPSAAQLMKCAIAYPKVGQWMFTMMERVGGPASRTARAAVGNPKVQVEAKE